MLFRSRAADLVLNRRADSGERLIEVAERAKGMAKDDSARLAWRAGDVNQRLSHALDQAEPAGRQGQRRCVECELLVSR